ncbi:unnamed protein product [Phaeothamnion confervicola]
MNSHQKIDERSLAMARAIASKVDAEPSLLERARAWVTRQNSAGAAMWEPILARPWPEIREILLQDTDDGRQLRQNSPFAGILTPQERWSFYRD